MTTVTERRRVGQTNERVELARYTVSAGERVIHGQRIPAAGPCCLLADLQEPSQ